MNREHYANYGGLSVEQYVQRYILNSELEMKRMADTLNLVDTGVRSLLDVGAGHGVFLQMLKEHRGIEGVGIEITEEKVNYAKTRGVDMRLGDASHLAFDDRQFDMVMSCEVIEHLPYQIYEKTLLEFARVSNRWVLITVPYDETLQYVTCPYCGGSSNPSLHFRTFDESSLGRLFENFKLNQVIYLGYQKHSILSGLNTYRKPLWPSFLVCPSCGYHKTASQNESHSVYKRSFKHQIRSKISSVLPQIERPKWIAGIYERH